MSEKQLLYEALEHAMSIAKEAGHAGPYAPELYPFPACYRAEKHAAGKPYHAGNARGRFRDAERGMFVDRRQPETMSYHKVMMNDILDKILALLSNPYYPQK